MYTYLLKKQIGSTKEIYKSSCRKISKETVAGHEMPDSYKIQVRIYSVIYTVKVSNHQNKLPREMEASQSSEVFKSRLNDWLGSRHYLNVSYWVQLPQVKLAACIVSKLDWMFQGSLLDPKCIN